MKKEQNYISFVFLNILAMLVLVAGIFVIFRSFSIIKEDDDNNLIKIDKKVTYEILTKENKYYDLDILGEQKDYIASVISKVVPSFTIKIKSKKSVDLKYIYKITGTLISKSGDKIVLAKDYELKEKETVKLEDTKSTRLDEIVEIDYDFYKEEIEKIKEETGKVLQSTLVVELDLSVVSSDYKNNESIKLEIPITNQTKKIKLNKVYSKSQTEDNSFKIKINNNYLYGGCLISIGALIVFIASFITIKRRKEIKNIRKRITNLKTSNNVKR